VSVEFVLVVGPYKYELELKNTAGILFMFDNDGVPAYPDVVPPFPLLSFHCDTVVPVTTILLRSAASNHKANPGIDWGENPHVVLDDDTIDVAIAFASYLV
jgi:hypothetical protein